MNNKKVLIILGTARSESNTLKALHADLPFKDFELVELNNIHLESYTYGEPAKDDFLKIVEKMTHADVIVFATPVYWYSMSGILKVFFDRLTELISTSKKLGRLLAHKQVYLFATGTDDELPEGFEVPFKKTSDYFDMKYERAFYTCTKNWKSPE